MPGLLAAILTFLAPSIALPQAAPPPTHCTPRERVVFSCQTASSKVISLCAARATGDSASMAYRFGALDAPELVYPQVAAHPREHFRGSTVMYSGGGGAWIAFDNGGFTYFVYTAIGKGFETAGVLVRKGDAQVASLRCVGPSTSEIGPAFFHESDIPAGADEFDVP